MTKHGTILLVDDDANDVLLVRKAFAEAQLTNPVQVADSGDGAIQYLAGRGRFHDRNAYPFPCLVLLDLRMPGDDGFTLLRWLYERPGLRKQFTVVVMSAAGPDDEVRLAYELGAQSFLIKPLKFPDLVITARRVKDYWIDLNLLPGDDPAALMTRG